ncbi:protein phosphatase Slingshot isoform X3 [Frankliniella occidentalis]|uniref:protein-serine/threonine phosphatase n=1 Tax=Frankliniella occidentalis TaxID=133901 RepID=A0A9C6X0I8_FRAOC|nr:protein phosphatase Slingshot isoform X3 [Frankliniella occidentalis]
MPAPAVHAGDGRQRRRRRRRRPRPRAAAAVATAAAAEPALHSKRTAADVLTASAPAACVTWSGKETLVEAVKLESAHAGRTRYLVVVSREGRTHHEESCLLGIDCSGTPGGTPSGTPSSGTPGGTPSSPNAPIASTASTVGLVLRVLADTAITLDGDGGFCVSVCGRQHIFKPVSVQAMWSALQTLYKVSSKARERNFFLGGMTHDWVEYYENRIESDRSCLNEWHAMDNIESRRPPSPDSVRSKPREREETERVIRCTLKEIMMSVDLDEVTSKHIRSRLEDQLDMDLTEYKSFIDQEMLIILGQMDAATEIFDHVYLGSEWNASNLEELQKNGVRHILNVTREIDNFFPGIFDYLNVRVLDDEKTDLLKHWDNTFKYITRAREENSKVLVHCKMGVSRSASVVIAYAMKAYNWDFKRAFEFVRQKRTCIKPNTSFVSQLETYQGILDAMKNKEKLQRSKSETNLKSPGLVAKAEATSSGPTNQMRRSGPSAAVTMSSCEPTAINIGTTPPMLSEPIPVPGLGSEPSGKELAISGGRPKSWSPDNTLVSTLFSPRHPAGPTSVSLEYLNSDGNATNSSDKEVLGEQSCTTSTNTSANEAQRTLGEPVVTRNYNGNVRMPCGNGLMYSVSQNKVVHLPGSSPASGSSSPAPLVKQRVTQLETAARTGLGLNFSVQSDLDSGEAVPVAIVDNSECKPEEHLKSSTQEVITEKMSEDSSSERTSNSKKPDDPFSNQLDLVFDREEQKRKVPISSTIIEGIPEGSINRDCPSRQSSWSSYDSAVVLREAPSRQSSWGSGDTRWGTLPSRNSSWGSYDIRPAASLIDKDDATWHPGTVRRTRHKIEEGKEDNDTSLSTLSTTTSASLLLHTPRPYRASSKPSQDTKIVHYASSPTLSSHVASEDDVLNMLGSPPTDKIAVSQPNITSCLSVSAPAATSCLVAGMRFTPKSETVTELPGKVKNLKKEFEAKSGAVVVPVTKDSAAPSEKVRSLPSSPVSIHPDRESHPATTSPLHSPASSAEDLSVKVLVGKYEVGKVLGPAPVKRTRIVSENELPCKTSQPPIPPRKSSFDVQNNATSVRHNSLLVNHLNLRNGVRAGGGLRVGCPTPNKAISNIPSSSVVVASVMAVANNKKQQQGKTHPLARLTPMSKVPRHTYPVYNTM